MVIGCCENSLLLSLLPVSFKSSLPTIFPSPPWENAGCQLSWRQTCCLQSTSKRVWDEQWRLNGWAQVENSQEIAIQNTWQHWLISMQQKPKHTAKWCRKMDRNRYFPVAMASLKAILLSTSWGGRCIKKWSCGYDSGNMLTNGYLNLWKKYRSNKTSTIEILTPPSQRTNVP